MSLEETTEFEVRLTSGEIESVVWLLGFGPEQTVSAKTHAELASAQDKLQAALDPDRQREKSL